jgi:hypothetical protein
MLWLPKAAAGGGGGGGVPAFVDATEQTAVATGLTITKPSVTGANLLVVTLSDWEVGATDPTFSGFTKRGRAADGNGSGYLSVYTRVIDGSEGSTFSVTWGGGSTDKTAICSSWSDAAWGQIGTYLQTTFQGTLNCPGITTVSNDSIVIATGQGYPGFGGEPAIPLTNWTTIHEVDDRMASFYRNFPSAGATGTIAMPADGGGYQAAVAFELVPG